MNIFKIFIFIIFLYNIFKIIIIKMAEIAKNAFLSRNYRLAAEIYERCLKDNQTSLDLHFCYADSLAKCGNLREALDVYSYCYRNSRLHNSPNISYRSPEHLKHAISALLENVLSGPFKQQQSTTTTTTTTKVIDNLVCGLCEEILNQPVTLICGHTVCRKCELKDTNRNCRRCGQQKQQQSLETNVLIKNLIEKYWPNLLNSSKLRDEGNELFLKGDIEAALEKYNEAHNFAPENSLVLSNRSHVLLQMDRAQSALHDADHVTRLRPTWGKGHYRRGMALAALGRHEEALQALCSCVALDRNPQAVRPELAMVLHQLLLPSLRNRAHCGLSSPQAPYWSRLSSGAGGAGKGTFMRHSPTQSSPARGACMRGGSSDCEDNSSGEEEMVLSQASRSQSHRQLQSSSRLHGIIDRLLQTVDKIKRLDKPSEDSDLLQQVAGPVDSSDFDCVLCCRTLWRPVTTPCGHTYCWMCLDRCLDYSHACPLCMAPLADYLSSNQRSVTEFVDRALRALLPQEWSARQQLYHQELRAAEAEKDRTVAVFVCTTAFPATPCPLFVYEPRYRLMIRRAVESGTKQFGIAACVDQSATGHNRYAEYGTMLEIRDWLCMSNGCSILSTIGCRRFKVQEGGETDGYDLAKVEFLRDEAITPEQLPGIKRLHDAVRQKAEFWLSTLQPQPQAEITQTFGPIPAIEEDWPSLPDGPAWAWWLLAILPLGTKLKVGILGTTSLEKRLRAIDKTLDHMARQRMKSIMAARATQEATRQQGSTTQEQGSVNPSQGSSPGGQSLPNP